MNKKIPTPLAILIIFLVIGAIVGISLWLCPVEKETFLVTGPLSKPERSITIENVSIPLDKDEAFIVFDEIMGGPPECWIGEEKQECPVTKTEKGWEIISGARFLSDFYFTINEEDKTIIIVGGY